LQAGGDLVNLSASEASGSLKLAALVVGEFHVVSLMFIPNIDRAIFNNGCYQFGVRVTIILYRRSQSAQSRNVFIGESVGQSYIGTLQAVYKI
jgi:hypothetical protein